MSDGLRYEHAFHLYLYSGFSSLVVMKLLIKFSCRCAAGGSMVKMWSARPDQGACGYTWYDAHRLLLIASILSKLICDVAV